MVCIFLIAIILIQKSSNTITNFSSSQGSKHRADSNFITKATGIAGAAFIGISLLLSSMMKPSNIISSEIEVRKNPKTQSPTN